MWRRREQDNLYELVLLKRLSDRLMQRIGRNYRLIVGINAALIALGVAGILQPTASALFHNTSTLFIGLFCMKNLMEYHIKKRVRDKNYPCCLYSWQYTSFFNGKIIEKNRSIKVLTNQLELDNININ